jgi:hypothetical protein
MALSDSVRFQNSSIRTLQKDTNTAKKGVDIASVLKLSAQTSTKTANPIAPKGSSHVE